MTSLQIRITQAYEYRKSLKATHGAPSKAKLAKASGVKASSVTQWFDGHTKNIKGDALLLAAAYLGVSAGWLASGSGDMLDQTAQATQPGLPPLHQATLDALAAALRANKLTDRDCLSLMQMWIE